MNLIKSNIDNLISLWRSADSNHSIYSQSSGFELQTTTGSQWPNKLWFTGEVDQQAITVARDYIKSSPIPLSIPYWHIYETDASQWFETAGFEVAFEQTGMSLKLDYNFHQDTSLETSKVLDQATASLWSQLFEQAFGYRLDSRLLLWQPDKTELLLASHNGTPVGTGIIHFTEGNIAGIHAMGIIPAMRRRGFAEEMMISMLNQARTREASFATLQASNMGLGLYLKMGFTKDFSMSTYVLNNSK